MIIVFMKTSIRDRRYKKKQRYCNRNKMSSSKSMSGITVDQCSIDQYNDMKTNKTAKYIIFKIVDKKLIIPEFVKEKLPTPTVEEDMKMFDELKNHLMQSYPSDPRYVVYDLGVTTSSTQAGKLTLIAWYGFSLS